MYSELETHRRGILIACIVSLFVAAFTTAACGSPINIEIRTERTKLDPLNLLYHTYYGSAVVINKDTVLTAFHNIEWPAAGSGTWATSVKVLAYVPKKDICVIKYPTEGQKYSRLAPNQPKVGDRVSLIARSGTYYGIWATNPQIGDQMSIKFDGNRPRLGDSGGGVYIEQGLIGIFLGYSGWVDSSDGEHARVASWATLKAFGIPVSGISAPIKPITDRLLSLPGTEDGKTPPKSGTEEKPEEETEETEEVVELPPVIAPHPSNRGNIQPTPVGDEPTPVALQGTASPTAGSANPQGASLLPTPPKKGSGLSPKGDDMMEMLITAALGAAGITATGGTGAIVYFGAKAALALYRRKRKPDTGINTLQEQVEEVLGRPASGFRPPHIPGRKVDEIAAILQLAELEGYDPLMGSTFGLFMQDEIHQLLARSEVKEEHKDIVRKLYNSTMDRLNSAAPLVKGK